MRIIVLTVLALSSFLCYGEDEDSLNRFLRDLDSDDSVARDEAERAIIRLFSDNPARRWEIGRQVIQKQETGSPEAKLRMSRIAAKIQVLPTLRNIPEEIRLNPAPSLSEAILPENPTPILIILISDEDMLEFYWPLGQQRRALPLPKVDFKSKVLFSICTRGFYLVKKFNGARDFLTLKSNLEVNIVPGNELTAGVVGGGIAMLLDQTDLPLAITISGLEPKISKQAFIFQESKPDWAQIGDIIKNGDLFALRQLAINCTGTEMLGQRRFLIEKGYILDPLLPYVFFKHIAEKYPDLFLDEYEYWKDKTPHSAVVGALFRAALESGKKIVEQKATKGVKRNVDEPRSIPGKFSPPNVGEAGKRAEGQCSGPADGGPHKEVDKPSF